MLQIHVAPAVLLGTYGNRQARATTACNTVRGDDTARAAVYPLYTSPIWVVRDTQREKVCLGRVTLGTGEGR